VCVCRERERERNLFISERTQMLVLHGLNQGLSPKGPSPREKVLAAAWSRICCLRLSPVLHLQMRLPVEAESMASLCHPESRLPSLRTAHSILCTTERCPVMARLVLDPSWAANTEYTEFLKDDEEEASEEEWWVTDQAQELCRQHLGEGQGVGFGP
jgi:hypothetical protein